MAAEDFLLFGSESRVARIVPTPYAYEAEREEFVQ